VLASYGRNDEKVISGNKRSCFHVYQMIIIIDGGRRHLTTAFESFAVGGRHRYRRHLFAAHRVVVVTNMARSDNAAANGARCNRCPCRIHRYRKSILRLHLLLLLMMVVTVVVVVEIDVVGVIGGV